MIQFFKGSNYNFIKWRTHAVTLSMLIILAGLTTVIVRGGLNFSIDFVGGTLVQLKFEKDTKSDISKIRSIVNAIGFGSPEVKTIGAIENNELQITVRKKGEGAEVSDAIEKAIAKEYAQNNFEVRKVETVGPKIGGELKRNTIIAALLSLLGILIYVGIRFNLPFGVASIIPLFHDGIVTLAIYVMLDYEITLTFVAAILTILGYSINDTIVIFDRIRENCKGGLRGRKFEDIINTSVNETLSRTIITSLTTLFVVLCLFLLGSEAIKDFAVTLLIGFIAGTYSTIYIASPILISWHKRRPVVK